jgi:hypothetical protein
MMGSRANAKELEAKELEALWRRNKAKREAVLRKLADPALRKDLSPKLLKSLPPYLRTPVKVSGLARPKGLRGPELVKWLILLGAATTPGEKRFDDCINALLQHGIVKPFTFEFTKKQFPAAVERHNEYWQTEYLAEVRARAERDRSLLRACLEVAALWAWPGNSLNAAAQQLRDHYYPRSKK